MRAGADDLAVVSAMKHPARAIALGVGVVLVAFAVLLASQVHSDPSFGGGKLLDKPVPDVRPAGAHRRPRVRSGDLRARSCS